MDSFGQLLVVIGLFIIIATINPDKSIGVGAGLGLFSLGLCILTSEHQKEKSKS